MGLDEITEAYERDGYCFPIDVMTVAEADDAESFSEGEEPRRSVVISVPTTD